MAEPTDRNDPRCGPCGTRLSMSCGHIHQGCAAVIPPDWADVREAARNAGWTRARGFSERGDAWLPPARDGYRQDADGWVIVEHRERLNGRRVADLVGPGRYPKRSVSLVDPSPAEILTAARLVGLIGGAS